MKTLSLKKTFALTFEEEIDRICEHYGLENTEIKKMILPLASYFEDYWEMVFSENEFELITAGKGNAFVEKIAGVAANSGLSVETLLIFEKSCIAFPEAITGIKLCFSKTIKLLPTLYIRTKVEKEEAFQHLRSFIGRAEINSLRSALKNNTVVYGLGYSEKKEELYLKTYSIGDIYTGADKEVKGFVSYRLNHGDLLKEHKTYLPEVNLGTFSPPTEALGKLTGFLLSMNYRKAGHIGLLRENDKTVSYKIYVERIGGIPTDFSAQ